MPDEVRCPGCGCARSYHGPDGCLAPLKRDCTLTPAEIDALLAIRAGSVVVKRERLERLEAVEKFYTYDPLRAQ